MFDDIVHLDKKDRKLPPNMFFKTGKGENIKLEQRVSDKMFTTKRGRISQLPKETLIDTIQKIEKKKQQGPGQYKNQAAGYEMGVDHTNSYKGGLVK